MQLLVGVKKPVRKFARHTWTKDTPVNNVKWQDLNALHVMTVVGVLAKVTWTWAIVANKWKRLDWIAVAATVLVLHKHTSGKDIPVKP